MRFIRAKELSEMFGVTPRTITDWCRSGYLPASKELSPQIWSVRDYLLKKWIEENGAPKQTQGK